MAALAPRSVSVGELELVPVLDAVGVLGELGELYPDVPAAAWEPYRTRYPELFADESWVLRCASYLIRGDAATVLVDTGVGPVGIWDWDARSEGALPGLLAEIGVERDDVDLVFLTHLHIDHIGWNTDGDGVVFFPRARYVVHEDALAFALSQADRPHVQRCVKPLADRFEQIDTDAEIVRGVTAFAAPGHYPGHMGLRLRSAGSEAVLIADVAVHPVLLDRPEWVYASDGDPAACAATRREFLP